MKNVLITGASSFLGKTLVEALIRKNYNIFPIIHNVSLGLKNEIKLNLLKLDGTVLPKKIDVVIHLAAKTGSIVPDGDQDAFELNVNGTLKLAEYSKEIHVGQFIYLSTASVLSQKELNLGDTTIAPVNFYSLTKSLGEEVVRYYSRYFTCLILRLTYPYGPGDSRSLVGRLFNRIKQGESVNINKNGGPRLNPIYIDDFTDLLIKSLSLKENLTINVGGPQVVSIQQMVEMLGKKVNTVPKLTFTNVVVGDEITDISLLKEKLGVPRFTFEDGVKFL